MNCCVHVGLELLMLWSLEAVSEFGGVFEEFSSRRRLGW